jgi:hypothetical protein
MFSETSGLTKAKQCSTPQDIRRRQAYDLFAVDVSRLAKARRIMELTASLTSNYLFTDMHLHRKNRLSLTIESQFAPLQVRKIAITLTLF